LREARPGTPSAGSRAPVEFESQPISRVLSWAIIHLGCASPRISSDLPESIAGNNIGFLFGLAPGGVYLATRRYRACGALLPHHFTLTAPRTTRRYVFCCTFRRLTPPRNYLAPCPVEPGLSSRLLASSRAIAWMTLDRKPSAFSMKLRLHTSVSWQSR